MTHRLDWNGYKGIARCTACSWVEVSWDIDSARTAHDAHLRRILANPPNAEATR